MIIMLMMRLFLLTILLSVGLAEYSEEDEGFSCDLVSSHQFCNSSLLNRNVLDLQKEAREVVNCLNGNIRENDKSLDILVPEELDILFKKLRCILIKTRSSLNCEGNTNYKCEKTRKFFCNHTALTEDKIDIAREIFLEYKCFLCLVEYSSEIIQYQSFSTLNNTDLYVNATTNFLSLLTFLQLEREKSTATNEVSSCSRIERFLNADDWGECLYRNPHEITDIKNRVRLIYGDNRTETDFMFEGQYESLFEKYLITAVTIIVVVIAYFVGNVVLLLIYLSHEDHRKNFNLVLLNLTISYVASLILNYMMFFVPPAWGKYVQMNPNYILYVFSSSFFILLLIYFTTTQILKRCFNPSFFQTSGVTEGGSFDHFKALPFYIFLLLSRILPVLLAVPYSTCPYQYFKTQALFNFTAFAIMPVTTLAIGSVTKSWKQEAEDDCRSLIEPKKVNRSSFGNIKLLFLLLILFVTGYVPVYLIDMLSVVPYVMNDVSYTTASLITFLVVVTTHFFNPILFHIISGNFRQNFDKKLASRYE